MILVGSREEEEKEETSVPDSLNFPPLSLFLMVV